MDSILDYSVFMFDRPTRLQSLLNWGWVVVCAYYIFGRWRIDPGSFLGRDQCDFL
jgi:hypothetical protein